MASFSTKIPCTRCQREVKCETGLIQHTAAKHSFPFSCNICHAQIQDLDDSYDHVFIHNLRPGSRRKTRRGRRRRNLNTTRVTVPQHYTPSSSYHLQERLAAMTLSESHGLLDLSATDNLDKFVDMHVQPDSSYISSCNAVVDRLVMFLQNSLPERYRPLEVIKGGSLGKGTAVKGKSDVDLTLFLSQSTFPSVRHVKQEMNEILRVICRYLSEYGDCRNPQTKLKAVQVTVSCHAGHSHDVDVLPACRLNISRPDDREKVYRMMENEDINTREYYVPSLSPLQIDFIRTEAPTKLKKLIRLTKYWVKEYVTDPPSSLLLELMAIHQWERKGEPQNFDLRKGFYGVLYGISNYHTTEAEWFQYYNRSFARNIVRHDRPYVIDPDNPFCNLIEKYGYWDKLQRAARRALGFRLFHGLNGDVSSW